MNKVKIRYRNITTREIRDVEKGSPEENLLLDGVTTAGGESRRLWMLEDEYTAEQEEADAMRKERKAEPVVFGSHHRRLTPGEVEMGITSYDQKSRELGGVSGTDTDEEEDEDEVEEEVSESPAASSAPTAPRARSSSPGRRRAARRPVGSKGDRS